MKTLLLIGALLMASPVMAQSPSCGPLDVGLKNLKEKYNEVPVWIGETKSGYKVYVTQSPKGTWTLVVSSKDKDGNEIGCEMMEDGGPSTRS